MDHIVLGIDFGTTNSCMSYYRDNEFKIIPNEQGEFLTRSCISVGDTETSFGNVAINGISNLKRDVNGYRELIQEYIGYLKRCATEFIGTEVKEVVITVPVYYDHNQRSIIKECFEQNGFVVLRIINEPTAAALAYTWRFKGAGGGVGACKGVGASEETVLVVDCGGGTTDISLMHLDYQTLVYTVKQVTGDNHLGGEDLTNILVDHFSKRLNIVPNAELFRACEKLKHELSFRENTQLIFESTGKMISVSRSQFEMICSPFFQRIQQLVSEINRDLYTKVIFVGGTTRIPYFKRLFADKTIYSELDPDQTVAIGAAVQGALIRDLFDSDNEFGESLLLDITNFSLGIEVENGLMSKIVSKNTPLPVSRTRDFVNADNDTEIEIHVYQGERKFAKDNVFLAKFNLKFNEIIQEKTHVISVTFDIDLNGIITVSARARDTEIENSIELQMCQTGSIENLDEIFGI